MTSERETANIFISYRIADTLHIADRLAVELQRTFGTGTVFFDRRTLEAGDAWDSTLEEAVKGAAVVLVLIGKKWLTEQNEYGRRRLDVTDDWVRREVEIALTNEKSCVIPVLVDHDSPLPEQAFDGLPGMKALSSKQAALLRIKDWDSDYMSLARRISDMGLHGLAAAKAGRSIIPGRIATRGATPFVGRSTELDQIAKLLPSIGVSGYVVLHGASGVGKSELAREYARRQQGSYEYGAVFVSMVHGKTPVELATFGSRNLGLDLSGMKIEEQCAFVLRNLSKPTLLIYDNVADAAVVSRWLPADDEPTHVLITTTWEDWDVLHQVEVPPLDDDCALDIVKALGGPQVAKIYGRTLVAKASGLPIQLCPATRSVAKAVRRHDKVRLDTIADEAEASFAGVWERLEPEGRLVLAAATLFNPDHIRPDLLRARFAEAVEWSGAAVDSALNACMDLSLLEPGEKELRWHRLLREFVLSTEVVRSDQMMRFRDRHLAALSAAARATGDAPSDAAMVADLLCYLLEPGDWALAGELTLSDSELVAIGDGLAAIGLFVEARQWYEHAVTKVEKGSGERGLDHQRLGIALHQIGYCLFQTGDHQDGRRWCERAVGEKEKGDVHGRVDHQSLGMSLHMVASCLSEAGAYEGARPWYERAVAEAEKGDVEGRVDHESLGRALHQVGYCLSRMEDHQGARAWYERAVQEKEKGDIHGRVNHQSVGKSLHQVAYCVSRRGDYSGARVWYERAVQAKEKGDTHGRVDHMSLGKSLHQVGYCLSQEGIYSGARSWYERAVAEEERGDIHGRVDHESVGKTRHYLGDCLSQVGDIEGARSCYQHAVAEKEKGDLHARVDQASLKMSREALKRVSAGGTDES